ncbi:uncharacterized protein LOC128553361, partial [Mercenaria mercenaria]|uniref:uncharacterized protein LOC128553361 n=1 Tax=Mercenaria mercenaria TaxID=6596 RepID=UPI00234F0C06
MGHCQSKSLSIGKMNGGTIYVTNINHFNSETIKCKKKQNYEDFRHSSSTATVRNGWTNSESNVSVQAESCFCWNSEHSNNSNWFTKNNFQSAKKTNTESRLKKFKKKAQKFFGRNRSSSKFPIQVQESSIQSEAEHMLDISNRYVDESNLSVISDVNVSNVQEVTEQATDDRMSIQNGIQEVQPISQYAETEREEEGFPSPLLTRNKEFNTNHLKANYAVRKKFGIGSGESCSEPSEYEPFSNFTQSREDDTELKSVLCTGSQKEMCPLQLTDCAYTREKPVNERSQQQFNTQQQIRTASEFQDENSLKSTSTAGYSLGTMSSYRDDLLTQDFSSYEISRDSSQNIRCGIKDHLLEAENENSHLPGSVNSAESRVYINSESSTCENKNSVIKECRENNSEKACIVPHNPVKPFENSEGDFDGDDMVEKADLFLNFERERKDLKEFHSSDKEAYPKLGQHFRKTEYEDNSWGQLNADIKDVEVEMNHAEIKTLVSEFFDKSSFNIDRYFSQEKSVHTEQGDHRRNNFLPRDLSLHTESKSKDSFEPFFTAVDETYFGVTLVPDYFTRSHFRAQSDSLKSFPSFSHVYSRHRPSIKSQSELQPTTGEKSFDYIVPASETKNESIPDCVNKKCVASVTEDTDLSNTVCPEICVRNRENVFPNRKSRKEHKNTNRQKKTRQKNKASKPIHGLLEKTKNRHTRRRVKCKHVSESDSSKPKTSEEDQENLSQISVESGFWSASDTKRNASQIIMNDRSSDMDSHLDFNRKITSVKKKGRKRNICIKVFNKKALLKKTKRHFKRCPANEKNKKAFLKKIKRHFKRCPANEKKRTAKSVVREICVLERPLYVFALGSYFDRLSNGPPPSSEERMQCEWFRLATFHNYTGNGNALALARNGFYHDHTEGPTSSRCYLCDARHSNWEMFDDVSAEHRRRSPRCLFHENGGEVSVNIHGASALSVSSATVTASSITSVTAAVNETVISLRRTSGERECLTQQPTEDPENRDCYLLALSQPRTQRALGHSRHSYSTIIAPR